jgi:epoxyqueuosine reductase QueG
MDVTREVKKRVLAEGMDQVGITSADSLKDAPEGRRPTDVLPTANCVIVATVHVLDSVYDLPYTRYEYTNQFFVLNSMLNSMGFKVSRYLESQGYRTIPIPAAYPRVNKEIFGILSHRHAAVYAGLGEMALNNLLTTPQFGSRIRLVSIVTEAALEADPPFEGNLCLNKRTQCELACVRNCPVQAISEQGVIDKAKCLHYQEQIMPWSAAELRCGVCVSSCPIGERTWKIPLDSRSQKVKEMKERWAGAKW